MSSPGERVLLAGVKAAESASQAPSSKTASWPKRGRGLGRGWPSAARRRSAASQAKAPRQTTTRRSREVLELGHRPGQARRRAPGAWACWPAARSARPPRSTRPCSRRPSSRCTEVGWLARPARCMAAKSQSPERSPVNTRPVRLPPWAAGARPRTSTRAAGSPKPGTGRPQYSSPANDARFSRATCSRHATSRGQRRQATTSCSRRARSGARPRRHARWSTPSISRVITGSSASTSAGRPVRRLRETSSTEAPMIAKASSGEAKVGASYCGAARWLSR